MTVSNNLPGIPRHYCGKHPPDALFPPWNVNEQSLLCLHRPLLSVSPVLGLSILAAPIFLFLGTIFVCHPCSDGGLGYMIANHLSPTATRCQILLRDKVAIQQALDRTGMHDSAR